MRVSGGLSGAPTFFQGIDAILGVVFDVHEAETVETFAHHWGHALVDQASEA